MRMSRPVGPSQYVIGNVLHNLIPSLQGEIVGV